MATNAFAQIAAVTSMNLRNLSARVTSSVVALIGIAGVVTVLIGVLSIGEGFRAVLDQSGQDDVAIILRGGATDEMGSGLSQDQVRVIGDAQQLARDADGAIVSPELYVIMPVPPKTNVPLRGVGPQAPKLREGFRIIEGRMFTPGKYEVIVGRGAAADAKQLKVGGTISQGTTEWTVTGIFADRGSVAEAEIWTDASVLQNVYKRGPTYQSARVRLTNAGTFKSLEDQLTTDPRLNVRLFTEREYYETQSQALVNLVRTVGIAIAVLMGLGAMFAALNTMYSAVSARTREIATLRALGFGRTPVIVSVLIEALIIGVIGGVVGMVIAYVTFNGVRASTLNFANFSQITFAFAVTPLLMALAVGYALLLGFIGGLLPSVRAARLPITTGLREL